MEGLEVWEVSQEQVPPQQLQPPRPPPRPPSMALEELAGSEAEASPALVVSQVWAASQV